MGVYYIYELPSLGRTSSESLKIKFVSISFRIFLRQTLQNWMKHKFFIQHRVENITFHNIWAIPCSKFYDRPKNWFNVWSRNWTWRSWKVFIFLLVFLISLKCKQNSQESSLRQSVKYHWKESPLLRDHS